VPFFFVALSEGRGAFFFVKGLGDHSCPLESPIQVVFGFSLEVIGWFFFPVCKAGWGV